LAVAQSDWQFHAFKGTGYFEPQGPNKKLRSLFSLHSEPFTVVVRDDSNINSFDDLKGKRVNIGPPGSGMRATMEVVMKSKGWGMDVFKLASELKASEQPQALCDNKIDAMIYTVGHPNGAVQEVATSCDTHIINVEGDEITKLVDENSFFAYAIIPGGMYQGTPNDAKTFGVKATFVTSSDVEDKIIYEIVKAVFENFDNFKTLHPVFINLEPKKLITEGNSAPLHKGAKKYFKEKGWM